MKFMRNISKESNMQEKYTESAKHALDLAKKAALSYGHVALGTEHILLGLM